MTHVDVIVAVARDGDWWGRGEAAGVYYRSDRPSAMPAQLQAVAAQIEKDPDRRQLGHLLPAGGARNAIDVGVSLNTAKLSAKAASSELAQRRAELGMPCADPMRGGPAFGELVDACLST